MKGESQAAGSKFPGSDAASCFDGLGPSSVVRGSAVHRAESLALVVPSEYWLGCQVGEEAGLAITVPRAAVSSTRLGSPHPCWRLGM